MNKAKYLTEIEIAVDDLPVKLSVYKHPNGGVFAIDSSYIEQIEQDYEEYKGSELEELPTVPDVFADNFDPFYSDFNDFIQLTEE